MATTKISELPAAIATNLSADDLLILNDGSVTSKLAYSELQTGIKTFITGENATYSGDLTFSGTVVAPTPAAGVNNTQVATTAFVASAVTAGSAGSLAEVTAVGATTTVDVSVGDLFTVQGDGASQDGRIKLNCSQNSHGVTIQAPPHSAAATYTLTLPTSDGDADQVLKTDGSGVLSWTNQSTSPFERKPVVTAVDAVSVNQGELWTAAQTVDSPWPNLSWYFYNYTGTSSSYNEFSTSGTVGGIENTAGSYTIKARAAWPFGMSDEVTINVTVNTFTLNQDNLFGGVTGMQGSFSFYPNAQNNYLALVGAVVRSGDDYVFDNGSIVADSANCIAFYSYTEDILVAFRYNTSNVLEFVYKFYNVTTLPTQNAVMPSSGSYYTSVSSIDTASNASSVNGKRVPVGDYSGGIGGTHYLSITPATTEFNNFGASGNSWSYGFRLVDDWVSGATGSQMLSPTGNGYFVNTVAAYGFGSSPYENVLYGDSTSGPYDSTSTGTSWNISTDNWLIGSAGDMVIVTFNNTTNTWKFYVEGVLKVSSTNVATYMDSTTTVTELRFGDVGGSNASDYPTSYGDLGGWPYRISDIFVANGTEFTQSEVNEIVADKVDITGSDNYGSVTTYATIGSGGITSVKGSATYARGDVAFPLSRASVYG